MDEELNNRIFVWIKSEKAGTICYESHEADGWLYFTDGSRINPEIMDEFLMSVSSDEEAQQVSNDILGINNNQNNINQNQRKEEKNQKEINNNKNIKSLTELDEEDRSRLVTMEMISQISKKNSDTVPIRVNLPAISVFNMLKDQMDKDPDELKSLITDLIEKQIDENRDQLKEQIKKFVYNYYVSDENYVQSSEFYKDSEYNPSISNTTHSLEN